MNSDTIPNAERDTGTTARLERLAPCRAANETATRRITSDLGASRADGIPARTSTRRRPHPSKKSRVAALGLSLATTGGLTYAFASSAPTAGANAAAIGLDTGEAATTAVAAPTTAAISTTAVAAPTTAATSTTSSSAPTTAATSTTSAAAAVRKVNGAVFTNKYGAVQVQAVFAADGSLSAVNVLQLPTDRKSVTINNRAVPVLNSEALAAQSAKVHTVSGATYTSIDYVKSLQSAIDTARASGITKLV